MAEVSIGNDSIKEDVSVLLDSIAQNSLLLLTILLSNCWLGQYLCCRQLWHKIGSNFV